MNAKKRALRPAGRDLQNLNGVAAGSKRSRGTDTSDGDANEEGVEGMRERGDGERRQHSQAPRSARTVHAKNGNSDRYETLKRSPSIISASLYGFDSYSCHCTLQTTEEAQVSADHKFKHVAYRPSNLRSTT